MRVGVPAVLEQKTTILWKCLYLLVSLKGSSGLGGSVGHKPQRWGRKPCSRAKYHAKRGQNQGFSSTVCVDEDLRFLPHHCPRTYGALFFVRLLREPQIKAQLVRLDELVQDYLSLVRVGMAQLVPEDLHTVMTQFAQDMTATLAAHGMTLQLDAPAPLGMVALHKNTFRRVLLNLVQNAIEAMPQGGTLTLRGRRQAATVQVDISDTGIGIPLEQYPRLFEPLHTTKPGGTGLGLYIVQEVVVAHGGQVTVQSTVGHGTTFTITLPLAGT